MSGWAIGFIVGATIVVVVVVLLLLMIAGARKVAAKAEDILAALYDVRDNTRPLWALADTNETTDRILDAAVDTRQALEDGQGSGAGGHPEEAAISGPRQGQGRGQPGSGGRGGTAGSGGRGGRQ